MCMQIQALATGLQINFNSAVTCVEVSKKSSRSGGQRDS